METTTISGYKVTNPDGTCRGLQFEVGKEYEIEGELVICQNGFHFCQIPNNCFEYYPFESKNRVFEVEAIGETITDGDKSVTSKIRFVRELTWLEVLTIINTGKDNTGRSNSGDANSGNRNSGNRNSGNRNSGYRNSGYANSGDANSGDANSGYANSGHANSGDRNSGYANSGYANSGDANSGNRNSGYANSGYANSGDANSGNRNSGAFCTEKNPVIYLFDKPTTMRRNEWENHPALHAMYNLLENTMWIYSENMTAEEKEKYPTHETTGGYLKTKTTHQMWADAWPNMDTKTRELFTSLPNFCPIKFLEITGIDVEK